MRETQEKGITLIALVVTIVILLILSGITINMLLGEDGIIRTAQEAKNTWENAIINEQENLNSLIDELNEEIRDKSKDIYVFLYDDGTLTFSNKNELIQGKTVLKEYGDIKGQVYTHTWTSGNSIEVNTPWSEDVDTITKIEILDEIKPTNTVCWFANCSQLTEIIKIENLNTKNVTDMKFMFAYCNNLTNLDLRSFDTSNVTDMVDMFVACRGLTSLNVSSFNTSNVIYMNGMFDACESLPTLDVSNFDTSKVTKMDYMFAYMYQLTEIKGLENFNTSNVTNMENMFCICSSLTNLNLNSFNTSSVTKMNSMFYGCELLNQLKIDNFDTRNVETMAYMFRECSNLTSLDLSSFNTSKATEMQQMFSRCANLKTIYVGADWTTENATNSEGMFYGCGTNEVTLKNTQTT